MTPRQLGGWLHFAGRHKRRASADHLAIAASAARGKPEAINRQIKKLSKD
jgi:hypothetical protein